MSSKPVVSHNAAEHQFEIPTGEGTAVLTYRMVGGAIEFVHTAVPTALEGQGYGTALARAALEHARDLHLTVIPTCPFVRDFMKRHPEFDNLRAPG